MIRETHHQTIEKLMLEIEEHKTTARSLRQEIEGLKLEVQRFQIIAADHKFMESKYRGRYKYYKKLCREMRGMSNSYHITLVKRWGGWQAACDLIDYGDAYDHIKFHIEERDATAAQVLRLVADEIDNMEGVTRITDAPNL